MKDMWMVHLTERGAPERMLAKSPRMTSEGNWLPFIHSDQVLLYPFISTTHSETGPWKGVSILRSV